MKTPEEMQKEWDAEIEKSGVQTEKQMAEGVPPSPKTIDELTKYLKSLTDRPHDYGTCVYAMAHGAVAAFNYIASQLDVTGFQVSMADTEILKHTRGWKWGKILNYENLLYPQYCDEDHFPTYQTIIDNNKEELSKRAKDLLAKDNEHTSERVVKHWEYLASLI